MMPCSMAVETTFVFQSTPSRHRFFASQCRTAIETGGN
jgi:hypothetical protein